MKRMTKCAPNMMVKSFNKSDKSISDKVNMHTGAENNSISGSVSDTNMFIQSSSRNMKLEESNKDK